MWCTRADPDSSTPRSALAASCSWALEFERYNGSVMATDSNIRLPAELLAQVQALATKEDKTADELTAEAVKRDIARRMIADLKRESK